jgi:UDP-N-acetyl-alpha-D-muramoyl-L-alanyl-L-glutamate epimerase
VISTHGSSTFDRLRTQHARFRFRDYTIAQEPEGLRFTYEFATDPDILFRPTVRLNGVDAEAVSSVGEDVVHILAFHLGLAEIPSYWKATCSPEIVVEAGHLDQWQIQWWRDLLVKGLGEFFYVNQIDFRVPDLVTISSDASSARRGAIHRGRLDPERVLIPVGGGKDSAVTLELLGRRFPEAAWWGLNPIPAAKDVAAASPVGRGLTVSRRIDPKLLELNAAGYLNGHTPFSAYLAFVSAASAIFGGYGRVAVSNERSSNEGNVRYLGHDVNHQYSKTFPFEQRFREYSARYLSEQFEYLSFVRPLYEIQISRLFARYSHYFSVFRSCNRGSKTNVWCGACPKCLFVYISLRPFVEKDAILGIFGRDLLADPGLVGLSTELLGRGEAKPFECVGTVAETQAAFALCLDAERRQGGATPPLLTELLTRGLIDDAPPDAAARAVLDAWGSEHALAPDLASILHAELTGEPPR